jgi:hypothetical protein
LRGGSTPKYFSTLDDNKKSKYFSARDFLTLDADDKSKYFSTLDADEKRHKAPSPLAWRINNQTSATAAPECLI